jgi:hypothetical protein
MSFAWLAVAALAHNPHDPVDDVAVDSDGRVWIPRIPAANWRLTELATSDDGGWSWAWAGAGVTDPRPLLGVEVVGDAVLTWSDTTLWVSRDRGATFGRAWAADPGETVSVVAAAPSSGGASVFVGTSTRLLRSGDTGASFEAVSASPAHAVALSPGFATDGGVVAAAAGAVVGSVDGGDTWSVLGRDLPNVRALAIGAGGEAWAATARGAWRSEAPGARLRVVAAFGEERVDLVVPSPAADGAWFVGTASTGLFRTTDGGATAVRLPVNDVLSPQASEHFAALAFAPGYPAEPTLWLATFEGLWTSEDDGASWRERDVRPPALVNAIAVSPAYADDGGVAVGTYDGGAYVSLDGAASFAPRTRGLVHSSVYGLDWVVDAAGSGTLLAGMLAHLSSAPASAPDAPWANAPLGELEPYATRVVASPAFADDGVVFVGTRTHGLWRTEDAGARWWNVLPHPGPTASIAVSPEFERDGTVLVSSFDGGVWRSVDGGASFGSVAFPPAWALLAPTPEPDVFLAATADGLWRSRDAGVGFAPVAGAPAGPIDAVAWAGASTVYVSARGAGLSRSDDGGVRFVPLDGAPAFAELVPSPAHDDDGTVFGAAQDHVWRSTDRGATWTLADPDPIRYEESTQAVRVGGGRDEVADAASCRGRVVLRDGDGAALSFVGRAVGVIGRRHPDGGRGFLEVDGERHVIDTAGDAADRVTFAVVSLADDGPHELVLTVAPGDRFTLDAFDVFRDPPDAPGPTHSGGPGAHTGSPLPTTPTDGRPARPPDGCGCATTPSLPWWSTLALGLAWRSRRRNGFVAISDPGRDR